MENIILAILGIFYMPLLFVISGIGTHILEEKFSVPMPVGVFISTILFGIIYISVLLLSDVASSQFIKLLSN